MDELEHNIADALRVGRGRAVRLLMELAEERDIGLILWPHICAETVAEGLRYSSAGVAELVVECGVDPAPYCSWLATRAHAGVVSEFHGQFVRNLIQLRAPGVWPTLRRWLRTGHAYEWLLPHCHDLLPATLWVELFETWPPRALEGFIDARDSLWLRVYWLSAPVRGLIVDAECLLPGHRIAFDRGEFDRASRSSSRFAFLRDALLCGHMEQLRDVIEEGLWDADMNYRRYCVEFADLTYGAVLPRVKVLAANFDRVLAFHASRRLLEI